MKAGDQTTEYVVNRANSVWSIVATVLGFVLSIGSAVVAAVGGPDTRVGIIVGAVISVCGVLSRTFASLGYIKSRTAVKEAENWKEIERLREKASLPA